MNRYFTQVKRFFQRLRNWFPSPLPIGMTAFLEWSSSIIDAYGFPDNDSIRFALATQIMHAESTAANKPKRYFALLTHKAMSNQIAHAKLMALKEEQEAKMKEEQAKAAQAKQAEATAPTLTVVPSADGQSK